MLEIAWPVTYPHKGDSMMRSFSLVRNTGAFAALACLTFSPAAHAQTGYASAVGGGLYSVNLGNATATLLGNTGINLIEGLALSSGGQLYATDDSGHLYTLNTTTGAKTLIGSTGRGDIEGLTFNGSTLLGTSFSSPTTTVFSIDPTTAATTNVTNASISAVRAATLRDSNDILVSAGSAGNTALADINLTTGSVTNIGALPGSFTTALSFASDGNLYSLNSDGTEYRIDPTTGAGTLIGNTGSQFWLDLTAAPAAPSDVPEPGSIALMVGLGVSCAGFLARRRRKVRRAV
jgi:hypothetical protein